MGELVQRGRCFWPAAGDQGVTHHHGPMKAENRSRSSRFRDLWNHRSCGAGMTHLGCPRHVDPEAS